jgi:hypothetical protein
VKGFRWQYHSFISSIQQLAIIALSSTEESRVKEEIAVLLEKKKAGFEAEYAFGIPVLNAFIESELAALSELGKDIRENKMSYDGLNSFFLRMLDRELR